MESQRARGTRVRDFLAVALALSATSALGQARPPVRSLAEIRQEKVVVQQWDTSCGAAALATVLNYQHGYRVPEKAVAEAMLRRTDPLKVKVRGGFSLLDLKRYADTAGFQGVGYMNLGLDDLLDAAPAIVPVDVRGYSHFIVVRGRAGEKILVADPAFGNRTMDSQTFQRAWQGQIGFVVRRRDGREPPNQLGARPSDFLRPSDAAVRSAVR